MRERRDIHPQNVLIVGSGGREHALGWKVWQSRRAKEIFFAPGNGGTSQIGQNLNIGAEDNDRLVAFARDTNVGTIIVGPEAPLVKGIVDQCEEEGLKAFGPSQKASELEGSKAWAAKFLERHNIPHPESLIFSDPEAAKTFIRQFYNGDSSYRFKWDGIVGKVDELAAGKGVELPDTEEDAIKMVDRMMVDRVYGRDTGKKIVIQERLRGAEVSMLAVTDGTVVVPLLSARDYKRVNDSPFARPEGEGPNTGGMASFAPVYLSPELAQEIYGKILHPTIKGMREEGRTYKGVLYAGIMLTSRGPQVLEYNCRFGDPETQSLMMLLSSDLLRVANHSIAGTLRKDDVRFRKGAAACVVLASDGYPGDYKKGMEIHLPEVDDPNIQIFHAGTIIKDGKLVTNGGRVMSVTAFDSSVARAFKRANSVIGGNNGAAFDEMHYRKKFL